MKKVIKEVKDFKPYIRDKIICFSVSLFLAFIADYIPFEMGINLWIWFLLYLVFFVYAYFIFWLSYIIVLPPTTRVRKADFDSFLINQGKDIDVNKKRHIRPYIAFSRKIIYDGYTKNGFKVTYIFDVKNNKLPFIICNEKSKRPSAYEIVVMTKEEK